MSLYYLSLINQYLGHCGVYSPQQVIDADRLEKQWRQSQKDYSFSELLQIFPEVIDDPDNPKDNKNLITLLQSQIDQYNQDLAKANELEIEYQNKLSSVKMVNRWFWQWAWDLLYISPLREGREEAIKSNYFKLSLLEPRETSQDINKITNSDVIKAKEFPVTNFIKFNHSGFAKCLWHNPDTNPSLYHYKIKNKVFCFSCNHSDDSIGVVQQLYNLDFKSAVKQLINK